MEALRCDAVLPRARVYPSLGTQTQRSIIGVGGNRLKNFFDKRPTVTFPAHLPRGGAERRDRRLGPLAMQPRRQNRGVWHLYGASLGQNRGVWYPRGLGYGQNRGVWYPRTLFSPQDRQIGRFGTPFSAKIGDLVPNARRKPRSRKPCECFAGTKPPFSP